MNIEFLTENRLTDFVNYCKNHRSEVDESLLCDEDLYNFKIDENNPTYLLTGEDAQVIGAVSLCIDEYHRRGKKARIRIMHSVLQELSAYELMLNEILRHTADLNNIFLFIKEEDLASADIFSKLCFKVERYSYVLVRPAIQIAEPTFPENYQLRIFRPGKDEEAWCNIRNVAFSKLAGSSTPMTSDMVTKMINSDNHLDGGMLILYHGEAPVGIVRGTRELEEGEYVTFIGPLALIPEYQHKGLGKNLLRAVINFGIKKDMPKSMLCVNAENQRALELYLNEGFEKLEAVVCYNYSLKNS